MSDNTETSGWLATCEADKYYAEPSNEAEFMAVIIFQALSAQGFFLMLRRDGDLKHVAAVEFKLACLEDSLRAFREYREAKEANGG